MTDNLRPLTPDILGYTEKCDAVSDARGREIVKEIRFPRPDGSTATVGLSRDHGLWLEHGIKKRLDQSNRSWLAKIAAVLAQLEELAERSKA